MSQESEAVIQPGCREPEKRAPNWLALLAMAGLSVLLIFQAFAYARRLPLSLGPRVILQPWLLQHGYNMYENIADIHSPLMPIMLAALVALVPNGLNLAKLVLVVLITLTTVLTFATGRRKIGWLGGLWAAWFFVIWSPTIGYGKLWYETFLAPIYLVWMFTYQPTAAPRSAKSLIVLGLTGGLAVLIKQQAALVFLAFAFWQAFTGWYHRRSIACILRELVVMGLAAIAPVLVFLFYQYGQTGSLTSAFYWMIGYHLSGEYESLSALPPTILEIGKIASCCLLVPAALVCAMDLKRRGDETWLNFGLVLLILVTGAVTAYPRFEFFHLQAVLPTAALVSAMTLAYGLNQQNSGRTFALGMTLALSVFWFLTVGAYCRQVLKSNQQTFVYEYSDLLPLAQEIRSTIGETDCVYIFPDDEASANLYYLLHCMAPKFWILHYSWNMSDWVKAKILLTLEQDPPEWVVNFPDFWDTEESAPEIAAYIKEHYSYTASLDWAQGEVKLLKRLP